MYSLRLPALAKLCARAPTPLSQLKNTMSGGGDADILERIVRQQPAPIARTTSSAAPIARTTSSAVPNDAGKGQPDGYANSMWNTLFPAPPQPLNRQNSLHNRRPSLAVAIAGRLGIVGHPCAGDAATDCEAMAE